MIKKILTAAAVGSLVAGAPAMAQVERHQNQSLNGYSGYASGAQQAHSTAFGTASRSYSSGKVDAVGSSNPSLESFNPNAVRPQPSRFGTAPSVAESPDFDWIDQADVGA